MAQRHLFETALTSDDELERLYPRAEPSAWRKVSLARLRDPSLTLDDVERRLRESVLHRLD